MYYLAAFRGFRGCLCVVCIECLKIKTRNQFLCAVNSSQYFLLGREEKVDTFKLYLNILRHAFFVNIWSMVRWRHINTKNWLINICYFWNNLNGIGIKSNLLSFPMFEIRLSQYNYLDTIYSSLNTNELFYANKFHTPKTKKKIIQKSILVLNILKLLILTRLEISNTFSFMACFYIFRNRSTSSFLITL